MPAKSKKQQRFFGLVKSIQEGKATGLGEAKNVAANMSSKDVRDFAATKTKKLPERKKESMNPDLKDVLNLGLGSTLAGLGAGSLYYLSKQISDSEKLRGDRILKYEKRLEIPKSRPLSALEDKSGPVMSKLEDMTSDDDKYLSEISPELQDYMSDSVKSSGFASDWLKSFVVPPLVKGLATPVAAVVPGLVTLTVMKTVIDLNRKKKLDEEIAKAKTEFEDVLSKTSNSLQARVDSLEKSAGLLDIIDTLRSNDVIPTEAAPNPVITEPSGLLQYIPYGLGITAGVGGLLGAYIVNEKMKKAPDTQKLKALQGILKRQISAESISAPIEIQQDSEGAKFRV